MPRPRLEVPEEDAKSLGEATSLTLSLKDILGYEIDPQWLHTMELLQSAECAKGILAQGFRILWGIQRNITEGYLKNNNAQFIGFGEGTAVVDLSPGETLDIELTRIALQGDREIYKLRATSQADGQLKVIGTVEMKAPDYTAVFPGNASPKSRNGRGFI